MATPGQRVVRNPGNRDVVLAAVQQNVRALQYAAEPLKADKEVVLAAMRQNGHQAWMILRNYGKVDGTGNPSDALTKPLLAVGAHVRSTSLSPPMSLPGNVGQLRKLLIQSVAAVLVARALKIGTAISSASLVHTNPF